MEMLSHTTISELVHSVCPQWTVTAAEAVEHGFNEIYSLQISTDEQPPQTVTDAKFKIILKYCTTPHPEAFRREPKILRHISTTTNIPVPEVFGTGTAIDGTPFFLMEHCEGENHEGNMAGLPPDAQRHIARTAGQHLGVLHQEWTFPHFGSITADGAVLSVDDSCPTWPDFLSALVEDPLSSLDNNSRFVDLVPALSVTLREEIEALSGDFQAVLTHNDYRLGNLLIEPETGKTRTVLDWEIVLTAPPEYDIVKTEQLLCNYAPHDSVTRERVRTGLYDGYTHGTTWPRGIEEQRELYLLMTRIAAMRWMTHWHTKSALDEVETRHREAVDDLL